MSECKSNKGSKGSKGNKLVSYKLTINQFYF